MFATNWISGIVHNRHIIYLRNLLIPSLYRYKNQVKFGRGDFSSRGPKNEPNFNRHTCVIFKKRIKDLTYKSKVKTKMHLVND